MIKKYRYILLGLIILIGLVFRLYKVDIALADHHSWRQADTAAVARNYIKEGWDFFRPKIDNKVPLHPGVDNDRRYFMVEPPIYNSLVAGVYHFWGIKEEYARLVSIIFSLGSMVFIYLIAVELINVRVGLMSALFYSILPYSIYYSRVIMPEPMIIFFNLIMIYSAIIWIKINRWQWYLVFCLSSAVSFSQKAFPLFLILPIGYWLVYRKGWKIIFNKKIWLWLLIAFAPLVLWRWWISHFPQGIPANEWLFNQNDIRFKGAFFYWIFAKRIGELILGWWGLPLLIVGFIVKPRKNGWLYHWWLIALLLFITVFAAGNVTHDYYQIPLIPVLCIFLAIGGDTLLFSVPPIFSRKLSVIIFGLCFVFMLAFCWYQVRDFYNIQGGVDLAGKAVNQLTPSNALVITGDSNDATLLYNTNRWGWTAGFASPYPNSPETIKNLISQGAGYYVSTKFDSGSDFGKYMLTNYPVISQSDQYILFKLTD